MNVQAARLMADLIKTKPHGFFTCFLLPLFYIEVLYVLTENGRVLALSDKGDVS